MLTAAAFVPGAPLVVPAISGPGAHDVTELRTACLDVAARLAGTASRWIAIGVGSPGSAAVRRGTFAGFGVDVGVSLGPVDDSASQIVGEAAIPADPDVAGPMATPMLVAGWIRGETSAEIAIVPTLIPESTPSAQCRDAGSAIGQAVAASGIATGLLVVGDGSFGLTARAPGGLIAGADVMQAIVDDAVSTGDLDAIDDLDPQRCADLGVGGRAAWQVASSIWRTVGPVGAAESAYRAAPFGVGYQVAWWSR